ncbi:MAG: ABC transporter substrate-binding protein [Xanthobacteraceae bacterium]
MPALMQDGRSLLRQLLLACVLLLGVAVPLPAFAQAAPIPLIGFLHSASADPTKTLVEAFRQSLASQGYVEGRSLRIEYRWADGRYERLPAMAADLVARRVALIAATGGLVSAKAAMSTTSAVPILFVAGSDPVQEGLVASIARPGGNATGVSVYSAELGKKRLELLRELVPVNTIGFLVNPGSISTVSEITDLQEATRGSEVQIVVLEARSDAELDRAFEDAVRQSVGALMVSADSFFTSRRDQIVALAARHKLPTSYPWPQYAEAGGLVSYGATLTWAYDQIGQYAARLLKGGKPSELPVQLPTTFEMVINARAARTLGISIPPVVVARADRVIE